MLESLLTLRFHLLPMRPSEVRMMRKWVPIRMPWGRGWRLWVFPDAYAPRPLDVYRWDECPWCQFDCKTNLACPLGACDHCHELGRCYKWPSEDDVQQALWVLEHHMDEGRWPHACA